ncbi:MAG: MFS transporter [Promethearchaeota archaeon]|nr:MAG: MFS transporter [Candidatus Lokiarchaeota archaeon]
MTEEEKSSISRSKSYFRYMILILVLVQILDAYTTSYTAVFPSKVAEEFLKGYSANEQAAIMALSIGIATVGMYFVFVNQFLADKLGRRLMLFITTLGMGVSALFLALSQDIIQYTIFLFLTYLFFSADMWLIYINEEAKSEKRAYYTNVVLAFGIAGPILMPIFRSIFITETSPVGAWRGMTLFPILLGIPLSIIIILTMKETAKYEEMKEGKLIQKEELSITFRENIRALFASDRKKELIALYVMSYFCGLNFIFLQLAELYIATTAGLPESSINLVIYIVAISVILGYLLTGIIADKIGRKPLIYLFSVLMFIATIILYFGSISSPAIFIFIVIGVALGYVAYDSLHIVLRIVTLEVVPTDRRGTGSGLRALITALGITSGFFIGSALSFAFGLGVAFILISIPLFINVLLAHKYLTETKGTDLAMVK